VSEFTAATWTASELLTSIYRACRLPDSGTIDYSPTVVLTMADEAIHDWGVHLLASARDGRLCTSTLRSLADDATEYEGNEYALPPMAVADSIESVAWLDESEPANEVRLQLIPLGMEPMFARGTETGRPTCYALRDRTVRVYPRPESRGSLRITYMRRHGQLVIGSDTTTATATATYDGGSQLSISATPSSFVAGAWVDIVSRYYPYRIKGSLRITSVASNVIITTTLSLDELDGYDPVGETVVISGKSPYVSLPLEMKGPLVQQVATQIAAELGDLQLSSGYNTLAKEGAARARDMLSPRAKSDKQKLINPHSLARGGSSRRRFWSGGGA
jgi:hypothetical protein